MTKKTKLYADTCTVKWGFYKGCTVRVLRRRLFGLFYYVAILSPYFAGHARIFGWNLKPLNKASKG